MATVNINHSSLHVRFTLLEKVLGLLRDIEVPLTAVYSIDVADDGVRAARGLRAPGFALPGRRKVGTWRRRGHRAAVSVRAGEPALDVRLRGQRLDQLLIGCPEAHEVARRLSRVGR